MSRPTVDLSRVRSAKARLADLAREHPELTQGEGGRWADHLQDLDELTMTKPPQQRQREWRERQRQAGRRFVSLWLDEDLLKTLERQGEGPNRHDRINAAIRQALEQAEEGPQQPQEVANTARGTHDQGQALEGLQGLYRSLLDTPGTVVPVDQVLEGLDRIKAALEGRRHD